METIRQHYIPQFILRNFCKDNEKVEYYDKAKGEVISKKPQDIFFMRNIYRDEINHKGNPTEIEKQLADFENEASKLINGKLRDSDEIVLTWEENDKLKLFLAVMSLRNKMTRDTFKNRLKEDSKEMYKQWQDDKNFEDLWKRNLGNIIKCRSINEVHKSNDIDLPFKYFILRDGYMNYEGWGTDFVQKLQESAKNFLFYDMENKMKTLEGLPFNYFIILERRGKENFSIGDEFSPIIQGGLEDGRRIHLYSIYPISYKRVLLLVTNGVEKAPESVRIFDKNTLKKPNTNRNNNLLYSVKKIYSKEVEEINNAIRENAQYGYIV